VFNPRRKRAPTPKPDYVFTKDGRVVAIADAKYRDLWEHDLGRDMLYQLTICALSQSDCSTATIFYPTANAGAREARIAINDPTSGARRGEVHLRPVSVQELARLVGQVPTAQHERVRRAYAERLAFG
jgi:5-methylcytosine-specific restriction enzyme subunit McrC